MNWRGRRVSGGWTCGRVEGKDHPPSFCVLRKMLVFSLFLCFYSCYLTHCKPHLFLNSRQSSLARSAQLNWGSPGCSESLAKRLPNWAAVSSPALRHSAVVTYLNSAPASIGRLHHFFFAVFESFRIALAEVVTWKSSPWEEIGGWCIFFFPNATQQRCWPLGNRPYGL